ncbi:Hsp33 family molecular chaperone HslO [Acidocella aminolytica]|jgi:molecular chaperone Hsp33|uniref:Heat shock protein Hsp33 n=1 Tax=Acidocella aminolytica 101 = DSM 11237 TaxID=1120923 RepID=A0A0D6PIG6_9PROT|nr:Hsp33 family molecular chaperone HslO [Acidocella aminolytica]GAN81008.1 heat shock protein Hsp33 [Acidocella aminolytica 101 = DSM 11237]GBQ41901.1 heat shock protein Hsp33 [Acidocella aminolytica 101 = DSM 11237]SHE88661.1 molecular chaperone Hsp33 [Acidocella aminolytica 101 = DSM 11237]
MTELPAFLDSTRPQVPDLSVPRGVTPFYLPERPVRGRLVRLGPLGATLLSRHEYPAPVRVLLGQALALAAGLSTALKFKGSFSIQIRGDGPVPMLVVDCTEAGALRGYVRVSEDADIPEAATARQLLGKGYIAFTVDQGLDRDPSQGIVAIEGESLADMTEYYFATSEQLSARVFLAAGETEAGWRASALVMERVAGAGGVGPEISEDEQAEAWRTASILAETVTAEELLDDVLSPERLLYRLFHGEGVAVSKPRTLSFGCRCSRQRLGGILEGFNQEDLDHMAVEGQIVMTCEFCNFDFRFARNDVAGRPNPTEAGASE